MIPDFQSMMLPLLTIISDGAEHSNREIYDLLAKQFKLTDEELQQMLPCGQQTVFTNRVAWAKAHLKKAGLIESPTRGILRITDEGRKVVVNPPRRVDIRFLKQYAGYDWHTYKPSGTANEKEEPESTPEELLESSYQTLRDQLAMDLLEKVKSCTPSFFERLVVRLLVAMGYGGSLADAGQAIGKAGDGGIDGIIKEDKLGLDVVCIQARRYENSVGRPAVQAFAGSMEGMRARKGVLLTTGFFFRRTLTNMSTRSSERSF